MIPIANSLEEAIRHFLNNEGAVACYYKSDSFHCHSLKQANEFYSKAMKKPKKIKNKVRPIKK